MGIKTNNLKDKVVGTEIVKDDKPETVKVKSSKKGRQTRCMAYKLEPKGDETIDDTVNNILKSFDGINIISVQLLEKEEGVLITYSSI